MGTKKYPTTPHFSFSPGIKKANDETLKSVSHLLRTPLVVTEKMDGGNWCLERRGCFARNHDETTSNPIFDAGKALWSQVGYQIDPNLSVFGEWLKHTHSIEYSQLPGHYLVFAVRDNEKVVWCSWEEVVMVAEILGLPTVPVLWTGTANDSSRLQLIVESLSKEPSTHGGLREGVVVRVAGEFSDGNWSNSIAKWVRKDHIQSDPSFARQNRIASA